MQPTNQKSTDGEDFIVDIAGRNIVLQIGSNTNGLIDLGGCKVCLAAIIITWSIVSKTIGILHKEFRGGIEQSSPKSGVRKVAWARTDIRTRLQKYGCFLVPILAFLIPLLVRAIPEVIMGEFLVGFDTIAYYVPNSLTWLRYGVSFSSLLSSAPLIYLLIMGFTSVGTSIVLLLKVLAPLLLGFLGLAVFFYANKALSWSPKKSLLVALVSTLYFVALRISWDMLRNELALIFLFLTLIFLQKGHFNLKTGLVFSLGMVLVVLTHQLVAAIIFVIVTVTILNLLIKKRVAEVSRLIGYSLPAVCIFFIIIYLSYFVFSPNYSGGLENLASVPHAELVTNTLGFLVFCYLPLLPFLFFGAKRFKNKFQLNTWIVWIFIPILLALISADALFVGGVLPYRWILLLTYPLAFYAVEGLSAVRWNWYKIAVGSFLVILSMGFIFQPNSEAFSYYSQFPSYVPKSMLQNTLQFSDCNDAANALDWAKNNMPTEGLLLVHEAFYGWATLSFDSDRLLHYFFATPTEAIDNLSDVNSTVSLYLIWWVNGTGWYGQPTVPDSFLEAYRSGNIAIYKYSTSLS